MTTMKGVMAPMPWNEAILLAKGIYRRSESQPIPLSQKETMSLAVWLLKLAEDNGQKVTSDDPHDYHIEGPAYIGVLSHLNHLWTVIHTDFKKILKADVDYNASWKQRGGVGAFMMLARKWDRLEARVKAHGWDIFNTCVEDTRREGAIDDVRDLRRYLGLVEAELIDKGYKFSSDSKEDSISA
jgi:hypothetical protein